jgi:hypothetical protein
MKTKYAQRIIIILTVMLWNCGGTPKADSLHVKDSSNMQTFEKNELKKVNDTTETYPEESAPDGEAPEEYMTTDKNCPLLSNEDKLIQNRKLTEKWQIFGSPLKPMVTEIDLPFEKLNNPEKNYIIYLAWNSNNDNLYKKVLEIAQQDTNQNNRLMSIECLSRFSRPETPKILISFLKEKGLIGMISALSLIQLGDNKTGFEFIQKNYTNPSSHIYFSEINTALMNIGDDDAIKLLEIRAEDPMPSIALDAIGALSLLGKHDYAFKKFKEYAKQEHFKIRIGAIHCLAYYIAAPPAIKIIQQMKNDNDSFVRDEANQVLEKYKLN